MTASPSLSATLCLASTSRYRAELLRRLDLPFITQAPQIDERALQLKWGPLDAEELSFRLALAKAKRVAEICDARWILAADQVAFYRDGLGQSIDLHKPATIERNIAQLCELSGKTHELVNAIVLYDTKTNAISKAHDRHRLTMRTLSRREVERYVEQYLPLDCAGGYRIEDAGIKLFERIESQDFTGIIGLPLLSVGRLLREAGFFKIDDAS